MGWPAAVGRRPASPFTFSRVYRSRTCTQEPQMHCIRGKQVAWGFTLASIALWPAFPTDGAESVLWVGYPANSEYSEMIMPSHAPDTSQIEEDSPCHAVVQDPAESGQLDSPPAGPSSNE